MTRNIDQSAGIDRLDRNTRFYHGNFIANYEQPGGTGGVGGYFHPGPNRPGVIQQNWAGVRSADTWQNFHAAEDHVSVYDRSTQNTLATRLWLIDQRARTPIPTTAYDTNPAQLMPGNYRAMNPQGR